MFAIMQQVRTGTGLTLEQVIRELPHDAGAIVVYVLLAVFLVFIWLGSRRSDSPAPEPHDEPTG
jgi:hypothetical protein